MTDALKERLWRIFKGYKTTALTMDHYTLADETGLDAEVWKEFLNEQDVEDWKQAELAILQNTELAKMLQGISSSKSVGQAQVINALQKVETKEKAKEGPIFIYTYVPADAQQKHAPNYRELEEDPFQTDEPVKASEELAKQQQPTQLDKVLNNLDTLASKIMIDIPKLNASSEKEKVIYMNIIMKDIREALL